MVKKILAQSLYIHFTSDKQTLCLCLSKESCTFLASYFQERKQCVKVGGHTSNWLSVHKGAPQGSIFGPFLFNVFQNDLLVKLADLCDIYNYADDNTIGASGDTIENVQEKLKDASNVMLSWYDINMMQTNPTKFQYIMFTKNNDLHVNPILIQKDITLNVQSCIKLLGVYVDRSLGFREHISKICNKAGRGLSAMARPSTL